MGPVVRRREFRPGQPRRRRGGKKGDPEEPPDHALGRSRGGYGTKLHLVCDAGGVPLGAWVSAGQEHESTHFSRVMAEVPLPDLVGGPGLHPWQLCGDKAYSSPALRRWLRQRHIEPVIPLRADEVRFRGEDPAFDREAYRGRNVIERLVGWLKECRRVATRFEKLALNYLAMLKWAMVRRCLRLQ
jgi:transposase